MFKSSGLCKPLKRLALRALSLALVILTAFGESLALAGACCNVQASNGSRPAAVKGGAHSADPVDLANGNYFFTTQDLQIPAPGPDLAIERTYNSQIVSHVPDWTREAGGWETIQGKLYGSGDRLRTNASYSDFILELDMRTLPHSDNDLTMDGRLPWHAAWINFCYDRPDLPAGWAESMYYFLIRRDGVVELTRVASGQPTLPRPFQRARPYNPEQVNRVRIERQAGRIKIFINGSLEIDWLDPQPLAPGRIGLNAFWSQVEFDNVKITDLATGTVRQYLFNEVQFAEQSPFGYGWAWNFGIQAFPDPAAQAVKIVRGDGSESVYFKTPDGTYEKPLGIWDELTDTATGYALRRKDGTVYAFDTRGLLRSVTDRNDNELEISYDSSSRPVSITDAVGRSITLTYGTNGKISEARDPIGRTVHYRYDPVGRLLEVIDSRGNATRYTYYPEPNGNMKERIDKNGHRFLNQYFYNDRVAYQIDPLGNTTTFHYFWTSTNVYNARGEMTRYEFGPRGQLTLKIDPAGVWENRVYDASLNLTLQTRDSRRLSMRYDARGNMVERWRSDLTIHGNASEYLTELFAYEPAFNQITRYNDPNGNEIRYRYDAHGNRTETEQVVDGQLIKTFLSYDSRGHLTGVIDPRGFQTTYTYDAYGNVASLQDAAGNTWRFEDDPAGRMTKGTDPLGNVTEFAYDANDNLIAARDVLGAVTRASYDGLDQVTSHTDANGNSVLFAYDGVGNRVAVQDALGNVARYSYDTTNLMHLGTSNLMEITDPLGRRTRYGYDKLDRVVSVTDPLGNVTRYEYDKFSNLTKVTDALGRVTTYQYDVFDRLVGETDPLGRVQQFSYDHNSNVTSVREPDGTLISRSYNARNQVREMVYPDRERTRSEYDVAGNVTLEDVRGRLTHYDYDALNLVTRARDEFGEEITYRYDALGRRIETVSRAGRITYGYDAVGRLVSLSDFDGRFYTFGYDAVGRRTRLTYPNGLETTYQYDAANRLINLDTLEAGSLLFSFTMEYDSVGNRTRVTLTEALETAASTAHSSVLGSQRRARGSRACRPSKKRPCPSPTPTPPPAPSARVLTEAYAYNARNELIAVDYGDAMTESFAYDPVGNMVQNTRNGRAEVWTYDAANQLLQAGSTRYSYDAKGQLIRRESTDGQSNLGWNPEGTLRTLETRNPMTGEVLVRADYRYNGRGLRTEKVVNAQTTRYTLDGPEILFESNESAQVKNAYLHSLTLDEVLLRKDFTAPDNTGFLHADALGSVRMTTDMTGTLRGRTSYFVYGETKTESGPLPDFRFTSRELDPESSLYYYRARYYDSQAARFLSHDPIGPKPRDPTSYNLYLYVQSNPVNLTDPLGLERMPPRRRQTLGDEIGFWIRSVDENYGRWGGTENSGGERIRSGELGSQRVHPRDSLDRQYKRHDIQKYLDHPSADINLLRRLLALPQDPLVWSVPPTDPLTAQHHRQLAAIFFSAVTRDRGDS